MKPETQQKIVDALSRVRADLSDWLCGLGLSEAEVSPLLSNAMDENGLLARHLLNTAAGVIPVNGEVNVQAAQVGQALAWVDSGGFASSLLSLPEPTPEELDQILSTLKNPLPNFRQQIANAAKRGPRRKLGGRPKELGDPEERDRIREEIKKLRGPGVRLEDVYQRLAKKYGVSPSTIKRIRAEENPSNEQKE